MKVKDNVDIKVFSFVLREKHSKHRKDHLNHRRELLNRKRFLLDTWMALHCKEPHKPARWTSRSSSYVCKEKRRKGTYMLTFEFHDIGGYGWWGWGKKSKEYKTPSSHSQQIRGREGQQHGKHWTPNLKLLIYTLTSSDSAKPKISDISGA